MEQNPLVTFFTNSFNRLPLLKNLLRSFEICNDYPHTEWIITDYGSTDGSIKFLKNYQQKAAFPVRLIFGDEKEYFRLIKIPNPDRRAKLEAILRKFRNDAMDAASGDYIFDTGTDHQFIRKGNWVEEIIDIFKHRENTVGRDDLSGIIPFGYFRWRLDKPNNARFPVENEGGIPYYIAKSKAYVDYSVIKKKTRDKIGRFMEIIDIEPNTPEMKMWIAKDDIIGLEAEYSLRCQKLGLNRVFMKYPVSISFSNDMADKLKPDGDNLIIPTRTLEEMKEKFSHLDRPISSDELCGLETESFIKRLLNKLEL